MKTLISLLIAITVVLAAPAQAGIGALDFDTIEQETRYKQLAEKLRCLVCQNQSIADSNAGLAQDLRRELHRMVLEEQSDQAIYTYMVNRYGDFVLYDPPMKSSTFMLWIGPFLLLLIGLVVLILVIRRSPGKVAKEESALSGDESDALKQLLNKQNDSKSEKR